MDSIRIKLDSLDKVKKFVGIANSYEGKVEVSSGKYTADGKSILAICSLDLKNELALKVESEKNMSAFIRKLKPYIIT